MSLSCFFHHSATPQTYTLSLHDALPISVQGCALRCIGGLGNVPWQPRKSLHPRQASRNPELLAQSWRDRKSTRLNSSHRCISYAVFCLKKKKQLKHGFIH